MAFFKKKVNQEKDVELTIEDLETQESEDTLQDENDDTPANFVENENIEEDIEPEPEILEERAFDDAEDFSEEKDTSELADELIDYFTQVEPIKLNMLERGKITKEQFTTEVKNYIRAKITRDEDKAAEIFNKFSAFIWSYDILDALIDDDDISDIKCYDYDHIRLKRLGKREDCELKFRTARHYEKFVEHVAIKNKVSISDQNAAQKFVDKESSEKAILRFNITTGFINSSGRPVLHIRKVPKIKRTEQELLDLGFFGQNGKQTAEYIKKRITDGGGFLIAGQGGAGKTTLINWMIDLVPHSKSGVVIQDLEELFSTHPDMDFKHTVHSRGEGKIEYTLSDLSTNALLTDEDYFIIGEIKGEEAIFLVNAVYTGAKGWASVHGASSTEALDKLIHYIMTSDEGKKFEREELLKMLIHLDTIVFLENFQIKEISEVVGYSEEKKDLIYKKIV